MVALERAGIAVERYFAYEIEQNAIEVSRKNYPEIVQCGDVMTADFRQYKGIDLLIGGSPCTNWSCNKNHNAKVKKETKVNDGIGWNIKKFYETIARIISEREQVKVTVQVREKEAAA